jgi:tetratricopeptide (TPR) repeat protein
MLYERDYGRAEQEFRRAIELNPRYPQGRAWYGLWFLQWVAGRTSEARVELARMLELEPLSGYAHVILSMSDYSSGRTAEAVDHSRLSIELDPDSFLAHWHHASTLLAAGRFAEAAGAAERALALSGRHPWTVTIQALIHASWNRPVEARALYLELDERSRREHVQPSMLSAAAAAVGERDAAIVFARRAVDERDPLFVTLARSWPGYDLLREDPRFQEIVAALGFPVPRAATGPGSSPRGASTPPRP